VSPPRRQSRQPQPYDLRAKDHLASLIRKHGPPTPVSSTSSLRKLTSTSPIKSSHLPPLSLDTPPASPTVIEAAYISSSGTLPIPIPRANSSRGFDDLPPTPLTGRFDQGNFLPRAEPSSQSAARNEKPTRKKKTRAPQSSSSSSRSKPTKTMQSSHGPSLTMTSQPGRPLSPQHSPKPDHLHLGNLPRFHPAVYQSPNNSPNNQPQQRSYGYRVSSGTSRDALRQYRELVAASVALPRNGPTPGFSKPSAPRLDPLGSPGPVTPLALEEAESYLAAGSASKDESSLQHRQEGRLAEREPRSMDCKGR
jgi:hypothetical protein